MTNRASSHRIEAWWRWGETWKDASCKSTKFEHNISKITPARPKNRRTRGVNTTSVKSRKYIMTIMSTHILFKF